jgi:hypothetical protein
MGTLCCLKGHSDGVLKGTIVNRLYVMIDRKALTADISHICRSRRSVCLLSQEEYAFQSVTSFSIKGLKCACLEPVLYDEKFIWFKIPLPFLIAHHSFPIQSSFQTYSLLLSSLIVLSIVQPTFTI